MLQVTLNTSLKLHGRATELPWSDFNRLVIRFTRHTLLIHTFAFEIAVMIATSNLQKCPMLLAENCGCRIRVRIPFDVAT